MNATIVRGPIRLLKALRWPVFGAGAGAGLVLFVYVLLAVLSWLAAPTTAAGRLPFWQNPYFWFFGIAYGIWGSIFGLFLGSLSGVALWLIPDGAKRRASLSTEAGVRGSALARISQRP